MRLLEPLNGIKVAQGHIAVHLIFFISMLFIDTDIDKQLHPLKDSNPDHGSILNQKSMYRGDDMILSGHGHSHPEMTTQEKKEHELLVFHILKFGHLVAFLGQLMFFYLKSIEKYNWAQFFQSFIVPAGYLSPLVYTIYVAKVDLDNWAHDVNYIRVWLLLEIVYFWTWLFSGFVFLFYAYVTKYQSIFKDQALLAKDSNVWNDKDSDDFLRYLKQEYFMFVYIISFLLMEVTTAQNKFVRVLDQEKALDNKSNGFSNPENQCYTILFLGRCSFLIYYIIIMRRKKDHKSDDFKDEKDERQPSRMSKMEKIFFPCYQLLFPIAVYMIWSKNNKLSDYNPFAEIWVQTEIIAFLVQVPGQAFLMYLVKIQQDKIHNVVHKDAKSLIKMASTVYKDDDGTLHSTIKDHVTDRDGPDRDIMANWENEIRAKDHLDYEHDFFAYTVLCYLRENTDKYLITPQKQAQNFYSSLLIAFVVISMLSCMNYAIMTNEHSDYTPSISHSFAVFYIKFPCAIALHFCLYPEVAKGMNLMKFANNQHKDFVEGGSEISFVIGLVQVVMALIGEAINLHMLSLQHTIQHCITHFVALEIIMEVSNFYFESLMNNKLKVVMHHSPKIKIKGVNIKFAERSPFHKLARVIYKVIRCLYVSFVFYFVPFVVLYLQWIMIPQHGGGGHGH